jgi:hypothetical protein
MTEFASRTGLVGDSPNASRRYLWTDAFAVCNFLELARLTGRVDWTDISSGGPGGGGKWCCVVRAPGVVGGVGGGGCGSLPVRHPRVLTSSIMNCVCAWQPSAVGSTTTVSLTTSSQCSVDTVMGPTRS